VYHHKNGNKKPAAGAMMDFQTRALKSMDNRTHSPFIYHYVRN
jgi:hypothetical protein